jgi:peptidoglycan/xylan/chitin deacetylase (PgdA/CDA1 family)
MVTISTLLELLLTPFIMGMSGIAIFGRTRKIPSVPGLLFHSISPEDFQLTLSSIPVSRFKSIISYLKMNNFYPLIISEVNGTDIVSPPLRKILLTFDDGCRSFFTQVLPLLEELKIKATIFPVAGYIGKLSSWDIIPLFAHLTKSEIREISDLGHEIGSHGQTHADLSYLSANDLSAELNDSKKILEDITGKEVTALSFPYGSWNTRVWKRAQETGYRNGTIYRNNQQSIPGLFPVFGVYNFDTPPTILSRVAPKHPLSLSVSCARIMSHFAKGAPLWKFDKKYKFYI